MGCAVRFVTITRRMPQSRCGKMTQLVQGLMHEERAIGKNCFNGTTQTNHANVKSRKAD